MPVAAELHWDLWLGPAPSRPYHPCYFAKRSLSWQNWWDFGNGALVEHNLLGTVAFRAGKKPEWDAEHLKAANCPEADRFNRQMYRESWTI